MALNLSPSVPVSIHLSRKGEARLEKSAMSSPKLFKVVCNGFKNSAILPARRIAVTGKTRGDVMKQHFSCR